MNVYQIHGIQNLGWHSMEQVYNFARNIHAAVYSFAFCEVKPNDVLYPHEVQNVFYVGQSGNEKGKHFFYDQKVRKNMGSYKAPKYGHLTSNFKMRLKKHRQEFEKNYEGQERKYQIFHEVFTPFLRPNYQVFCHVMIPPDSLRPNLTKAWLRMIEDTVIYCYGEKWGNGPICNLENQTINRRLETSLSNHMLKTCEESNLNKFFIS